MTSRLIALIAALGLSACGAGTAPQYQSAGPYAPYPNAALATPALWITYPTEGDTAVCLIGDAATEFPVFFTMYNPPTGGKVRLRLDRHISGGKVLGLFDSSPVLVSMAGQANANRDHLIDGQIVNADGSAPTQKVPALPPSPSHR